MLELDGSVVIDDEGEPMDGPIEFCADCHSAYSSTDYLGGLDLR